LRRTLVLTILWAALSSQLQQ